MTGLVRWAPKIAVASADDIARFGPQAARIRALLEFLPTMSDDAMRMSGYAWDAAERDAWDAAKDAAINATGKTAIDAARESASDAAWDAVWDVVRSNAGGLAGPAAMAESVSDRIGPATYRTLTNPLATGRAVDVLAPRYRNSPFLEIVRDMSNQRRISSPSDIVAAGRVAGSPEDIRDIALALIGDGVEPLEAFRMARRLA